MKEQLTKLLSVGSAPLGEPLLADDGQFSCAGETIGAELAQMLLHKNGFYAFASALHVLPSGHRHVDSGTTLQAWNSPLGWRSGYGLELEDRLFFAEDLFGMQFCLHANQVFIFDPETAAFTHFAESLEHWAEQLLADYDYLTGYSLAHAWQSTNRALAQGERLLPKVPFVLGGKFEINNLYACEAEQGMALRGELATQIRELPDGTAVTLQTSAD